MYHILRGGFETKHPNTFVRSCPVGISNYLMLIIHTAGTFQIASKTYHVTPGHALVIAPGTPYWYTNPNGAYIDDWLHFQPENPQKFAQHFPMTDEPFSLEDTEIFTTLIRQILWENAYSETPYMEENIDALFTILINHLIVAYQNQSSTPPLNFFL